MRIMGTVIPAIPVPQHIHTCELHQQHGAFTEHELCTRCGPGSKEMRVREMLSTEHIRVYKLFPPLSSMTHVPQSNLVVKSMLTPVVIDFAKIRDQKNRGMLKTGAKEKAFEMWQLRGQRGHRC